jgi:transposase-like protein
MDQRIRFIREYLEDDRFFRELCQEFDISRKTGYKWVERYLSGRSQRPHGQAEKAPFLPAQDR